MTLRVAILDDVHDAYRSLPQIDRLRERAAEVRIFTGPFGDPRVLRGYEALIANRERTRFTRELFEQLPDLKILVQTGGHAYHVDLDAARERGVVVAKAPGASAEATPELTIGLMLAVMRQIPRGDAAIRRGEWISPLGRVLSGKTLGVLGLSRVGSRVARLAQAFGMNVLAWSRTLTTEEALRFGAHRRELDALLAESDVVSVHVALTPSSRGMLDAAKLALMKPGAYLVNTSRGPVVDEAAMIEALTSGRLAGAALDVFDREPLPADHPLTTLPNVVLTPHLGWPTDATYAGFAEDAVDALFAYLDGRDVPVFEPHR